MLAEDHSAYGIQQCKRQSTGSSLRLSCGGDTEDDQERNDQRLQQVRIFLCSIESAMYSEDAETKQWLAKRVDPRDTCVRALIKIVLQPKYKSQLALLCTTLRAVQLLLQVANSLSGIGVDGGVDRLRELAGEPLAVQTLPQLRLMAAGPQPFLACNALLVLAELGSRVDFSREFLERLLELLTELPERSEDVVSGALRVYCHQGSARQLLIEVMTSHPNGRLLGEVMLQVVNRCGTFRDAALEVLTSCLYSPVGRDYLYSNDARVLLEILLRELPNHMREVGAFCLHADCLKALMLCSEPARSHRRDEVITLLEDLSRDEVSPPDIRLKCREVLQAVC